MHVYQDIEGQKEGGGRGIPDFNQELSYYWEGKNLSAQNVYSKSY